MAKLSAETVTVTMIKNAVAWARSGRMNAHKRALLGDIEIAGGMTAKNAVVNHARHHARELFLSESIADSIEKYLAWDSSCDPSKLGALNLVAHIGECIAAMYQHRLAEVIGIAAVESDE